MKVGRKVKIMMFYLIIVQWIMGAAFAPEIFYVDLDKPRTQELTVLNNTNKHMRYKVDMLTGVDGEWSGKNLSEEWIRFYPKVISLAPQSRGIVRFRIISPKEMDEGEYMGQIYFEEMEGLKKSIDDSERQDDEAAVGMDFKMNYKLAIYGQKGEAIYSGNVENFELVEANKKLLSELMKEEVLEEALKNGSIDIKKIRKYYLDINNDGNATLRPKMKVTYLDNKGDSISSEESLLGVFSSGKNIAEGWLQNVPQEARKLRVEVFHYDIAESQTTIKIHENEYNL